MTKTTDDPLVTLVARDASVPVPVGTLVTLMSYAMGSPTTDLSRRTRDRAVDAANEAIRLAAASTTPAPAPTLSPAKRTATFTVEVGRFIANQVEMRLREAAHGWVNITIEKKMSLIEGVLLVTVSGDAQDVSDYLRSVHKWSQQLENNHA